MLLQSKNIARLAQYPLMQRRYIRGAGFMREPISQILHNIHSSESHTAVLWYPFLHPLDRVADHTRFLAVEVPETWGAISAQSLCGTFRECAPACTADTA